MFTDFTTDAARQSNIAAPVLTRAVLERNGMADILRRDSPGKRIQNEVELTVSLNETLRTRPAGDMWLFGYGSLIWNPAIRSVETRVAKIDGWHRSFCLSTNAGRGSPEVPGLVLALDEGGACLGTAYRIAEEHVITELQLLWRREMLCAAYIPEWVEIKDQSGRAFGHSLAFTINTESSHYAANLTHDQVVKTLATAAGGLGTAADYLFRTRDSLRAHGIPDLEIERLAAAVELEQGRGFMFQERTRQTA
jgi:cation transport protein ChaC